MRTSCPTTPPRTAARSPATPAASPGCPAPAPSRESWEASRTGPSRWSAAAAAAEEALASRLREDGASPRGAAADLASANAWLLSLERSLCDPAGLPQRGWFKHLIYAPLPSYLAETLPGIREALVAGETDVARVETERLGRRIVAATEAARRIVAATEAARTLGATEPARRILPATDAVPTALPPRPTPPRT